MVIILLLPRSGIRVEVEVSRYNEIMMEIEWKYIGIMMEVEWK